MNLDDFIKLNEATSKLTAGIIFIKNDKILGIKGPKDNAFDIPKGQKDKNEKKIETARRETKEEIGFRPKASELQILGTYPFKNKNLQLYVYSGLFSPKPKKMHSTEKIKYKGKRLPEKDTYEWIPINQIHRFKNSLVPVIKQALKKLYT